MKSELLTRKNQASINFGFATALSSTYQMVSNAKHSEEDANMIENYICKDDKIIRGAFLIQTVNTVPLIYEGPAGREADTYIQSLSIEHFELIRKFVEKNDPTEMEDFLWIQDNATSKITILSMENFRKNMKAFPSTKHVRWRDISLNEINVCQYDTPTISISYWTRIIHCIYQNKHFFWLSLWVIMLLSLIVIVIFCIIHSSSFKASLTNVYFNSPQKY
ncbi:hypothetical protein LOAG_18592 [Loa loa]|uniref:Uncharacterized protein n=1 Tax=Loa loa TaxID=7209 RepID=A0A1S0UEM7_LOALO|nr:hypothetical protein LOAG_18592 [Loa loa]EJD74035.1 hypothetical protein LOAG_18592 [Loa loa]